jgi:hypothetical protein
MATEDFSFPTIGDALPCGIDSPPLWHLSPASSPNSCREEPPNGAAKGGDQRDEEDCFPPRSPIEQSRRKSFSSVQGCRKAANDDDDDDEDDDEEDKMDMLWEDFNEELSRTCSTSRSNTSSSRDMVELGCVKALTTSKNHGAALTTRKPAGMVVIMKVLKKLFLLQNSHRKLKIRG